ncbi:MAG TPA: hypothetical protein VMH22_14055 [bacterium]|nr:hypothetical protein [bacterium]
MIVMGGSFATAAVLSGLVQLLVVLVGAVLISAAVQGFKAEWQALFKHPFEGAPARILVYIVSALFQIYNGHVHSIGLWEVVVLAILTAFSATGLYDFAKKRQSA